MGLMSSNMWMNIWALILMVCGIAELLYMFRIKSQPSVQQLKLELVALQARYDLVKSYNSERIDQFNMNRLESLAGKIAVLHEKIRQKETTP